MRFTSALQAAGYLSMAALPLAYLQVPGLPPFLRALPLMGAGLAFAGARLLGAGGFPAAPAGKAAGWAAAWIAWQALSALWAPPAFRWAALWPCLILAAALAAGAGLAGTPGSRRARALILAAWGLALGIYALNLASGGGLEPWAHGGRLEGDPIDHLPFGNRNTAAILVSTLIPLAAAAAWGAGRERMRTAAWPALALLGWLLVRTGALGAWIGLGLGGLAALGLTRRDPKGRSALLLAVPLLLGAGFWLAASLRPGWRLETSLGLRSLVWESALGGWLKAPWAGSGAGTFALRFPELSVPDYPYSRYATPRVLHAYNLPLQALVEGGLIGGLLAALALGHLLAALSRQGPGWRGGTLWASAALLVQGLGGDALTDPLGLGCLAFAAGAGLSATAAPPADPRRPRASHTVLALSVLLGGALALGAEALQIGCVAAGHARKLRAEREGGDEAARLLARAGTLYRLAAESGIPSTLRLDARFEQGRCLMHLSRPWEAMEAFRDLMAMGGPYGNARREAGRAALRAGRDAQAGAWLGAHLAWNPCDVEARRLALALAPQEPGRGRLLAGLRAAAGRVPDNHPMPAQAAALCYEEGDWEGAWILGVRALRPRPGLAGARIQAMDAGLKTGRVREALGLAGGLEPAWRLTLLEDMDRRIAGRPDAWESLGMRVLLRLSGGDIPGARADLDAIPDLPMLSSWRDPLAALIQAGAGAAPD